MQRGRDGEGARFSLCSGKRMGVTLRFIGNDLPLKIDIGVDGAGVGLRSVEPRDR